MSKAKSKKSESPHLLNEKGELDFAKLLETNPDLLASFIHPREDEDAEGSGGDQSTSMSFAIGNAALRDAKGLSMSYAPLNSAEQVRDMSMSAQHNLGIESAQGLNMDLGQGSSTNPFGSADDTPTEKKDKKAYRKKIKGQ